MNKIELTSAIKKNFKAFGFDQEMIDSVLKTVRVNREARYHTGTLAQGYFCIEETGMSYDYPSVIVDLIDQISDDLKGGRFVEPINSVEFSIYE